MIELWNVICETKRDVFDGDTCNTIYNYGVYKSLDRALGVVMWENRSEAYDYTGDTELRFSRLQPAETEGDYVCYLIDEKTNEIIETYLIMRCEYEDEEEKK